MKKGNLSKQQKSQWVMVVGYAATVLALLLMSLCCQAQNEKTAASRVLRGGDIFIENKGQLADTDGKVLTDVHYSLHLAGMDVYFRKNGLSMVMKEAVERPEKDELMASVGLEDINPIPQQVYRLDMSFENSNPSVNIQAEGKTEEYFNYYYGHCPEGITGILGFKRLTYQNIYPGIDLVFYGKNTGLKYDILVHPGADLKQFQIKYSDALMELLPDGKSLQWNLPFGSLSETLGVIFQTDEAGEKTRHKGNYTLKNDLLGFNIPNYDPSKPLLIDPFFTYYGGAGSNDFGRDIDIDNLDNILVTGDVNGVGLPVSAPGGYTQNYAGISDAFVVKFNTLGQRLWSTYYGGSSIDEGYGVTTDANNTIFLTGLTRSSNFPIEGTSQPLLGATDAFLVSLNPVGVRNWAKFVGGDNFDGSRDVVVDGNNNVLICGSTKSPTFPVTGCVPSSFQGGAADGFVARFNNDGLLLWATFIGGSSDDAAYGLISDNNNDVIVTGYTESSNFVPALSGTRQGIQDVFIVKFNTNCLYQWGQYFGGLSSSIERGNQVAIDQFTNDIVITGLTDASNFPTTIGVTHPTYLGYPSTFVSKFNAGGTNLWSSYYPGIVGNDIAVDNFSGIWITGSVDSANAFIPTTPSGVQPIYGGGKSDAFVANISSDGISTVCATYYGGSSKDYGNGLAIDNTGKILITGETSSDDLPGINASSHQSTKANRKDAFVAQICANCGFPQDTAYIVDEDTIPYPNDTAFICQGDTAHLMNLFDFASTSGDSLVNYQNISTYSWFNVTGWVVADLTDPTVKDVAADNSWIKVSPLVTTTYRLISDAFGCREDTSYITVKHVDMPTALFTYPNDTLLMCGGDTTKLEVALTGLASWNMTIKHVNAVVDTSYQYDTIAGSPTDVVLAIDSGWYYISYIQDFNCDTLGEDSIYVKWHTMPKAWFTKDTIPNDTLLSDTISICLGDTTDLEIKLTGAAPWNIKIRGAENVDTNNIIANGTDTTTIVHRASHEGWYYIRYIKDINCDSIDQDSIYLNLYDLPTATITGGGDICKNDSTELTITFSGFGVDSFAVSYQYDNGTPPPIQIDTINLPSPFKFYVSDSGTYKITYVADSLCTNSNITSSTKVTVHPKPSLTITNDEHSNPDNTLYICEGDQDTINLEFTGSPDFTVYYTPPVAVGPPTDFTSTPDKYNLIVNTPGKYLFTKIEDAYCDSVFAVKDSVFIYVEFHPQPTVEISTLDPFVCLEDSATLVLTMGVNGPFEVSYAPSDSSNPSPLGGLIDGHQFKVKPDVPTYYKTLSITDNKGCTAMIEDSVLVDIYDSLYVVSITETCNGTNDSVKVTITLAGGDVITYGYLGITPSTPLITGSFTGNVWTSDWFKMPDYEVHFFDGNHCDTLKVIGSKNCNCSTDVGAMTNDTKQNLCDGQFTTPLHDGNQTLDNNDVFTYALSTVAVPTVADSIIVWSNNGIIGYDPLIMTCNTTYYLLAIAGNDSVGNKVKFSDPCLSISNAVPVLWRTLPTASIDSPDFSLCADDSIAINVLLSGCVNSFTYTLDNLPYTIAATSSSHYFRAGDTYRLTQIAYDNAPACPQTINDTLHITALGSPSLVSQSEVCVDATSFTATIVLTGGESPYSFIDSSVPIGAGTGFSSVDTFTGTFSNGGYKILFYDANHCDTLVVTGNKMCNCNTSAGAIATNDINLCEDGQTSIIVTNPWTNDGDDVFEFILHDGGKNTLGQTKARNTTGRFTKDSLMCGVPYFITGIAGNDDGNGHVDINDPCMSRTAGVEVLWRCNPSYTRNNITELCIGKVATITLTSFIDTFNVYIDEGDNIANNNLHDSVVSPYDYSITITQDTLIIIDSIGYINDPHCYQTTNDSIRIKALDAPKLVAGSVTEMCNSTNDSIQISLELQGGDVISYRYLGIAPGLPDQISGNFGPPGSANIWTSDWFKMPNYEVHFFDGNHCDTLKVTGNHVCNCTTDAGTMDTSTQNVCENASTLNSHNNDEVLDGNDVLEFILHDGSASPIGAILDRNNTGVFAYDLSYLFNTTYYITAVAGNHIGNGEVDLVNDPCFDWSTMSTPVIFRELPTMTMTALPNDSICIGDTTQLEFTFPTGNPTYNITEVNGLILPLTSLSSGYRHTVNPTVTTSYAFTTVTDAYCTNTINESMTIVLPEPFDVTPSQTAISCHDSFDGALSVAVTGGYGNYNYQWYKRPATPIGTNQTNISNLGPGDYFVVISDYLGCEYTEDFNLAQPLLFDIDLVDVIKETCFQDSSGSIEVVAQRADSFQLAYPVFRDWQKEGIFIEMHFLPNTNLYEIIARDTNGCIADTIIDITGLTPITWINVPDSRSICPNESTVLQGEVTGGNGGYTYYWDNTPGSTSYTVSPTESTEICVFALDQKGCPSTKICAQVTLPEPMNLVTNTPPNLCPNTDGILSTAVTGGAPPYTYNWANITNPPASYSGANWPIMIDTTTRFEITITDDCGTSVSSIETVLVPEPLLVTFDIEDDAGCAPHKSQLTNTTVGNYKTLSWDFGDSKYSPFQPITHTWNIPSIYTVTLTLTDSYGCDYFATKDVSVYPSVVADFSFNPRVLDALLPETQLVNHSVNADDYLWTVETLGAFTDFEPLLKFPEFSEGKYTVCLYAENEWCEDSLCKKLVIKDENLVFVPNFFTPNADNINDMFHPVLSSSNLSLYEFHIFDRWGELIFSSTQYEQGWNGTYKNKPVKPDTYTWKLRVRFEGEAPIRKHMGTVTIGK